MRPKGMKMKFEIHELKVLQELFELYGIKVFTSRYAGVQCSAMSLTNIVRTAILGPNQWDVNILNANILADDSLLCWIRT